MPPKVPYNDLDPWLLEHSQRTLTLDLGTELLCMKHLVIMFYLSVKFR